MSQRFFETQLIKLLDRFDFNMRINVELLLVFYLVKYFNLSNILEIGFFQGQTFASLLEATPDVSHLTAVDIKLQLEIFNQFYKNSKDTQNKIINLKEMPSDQFRSDSKYDFINVDGDHSYPVAFNDIVNASTMITQNGILMIDDYKGIYVDRSIDEFIKLNTGFVPFIISEQASWWHHESQDATDFLDNVLEQIFSPFCSLYNTKYKSFDVKEIKCCSAITTNNDIFKLICEKYKI